MPWRLQRTGDRPHCSTHSARSLPCRRTQCVGLQPHTWEAGFTQGHQQRDGMEGSAKGRRNLCVDMMLKGLKRHRHRGGGEPPCSGAGD